jgi:hypothetical protein
MIRRLTRMIPTTPTMTMNDIVGPASEPRPDDTALPLGRMEPELGTGALQMSWRATRSMMPVQMADNLEPGPSGR